MEKPWFKSYDPGVSHTIETALYSSIEKLLEESFAAYPNSICFSNFGEVLTYRQVDELSKAYAGFLQTECGLVKGDRMAIMMPNVLQYPIALFGAFRSGIVIVNICPLYTEKQVHEMLKITGAKCILVLSNFAHIVELSIKNTDVKNVIVTEIGDLFSFHKRIFFNFFIKYIKKMVPPWVIPGAIRFREAVKPQYQEKIKKIEIESSDLACLQFTEGRETGVSKCAMLSHHNIVSNVLQMSIWLDSFFRQKHKTSQICIFPFFKLAALSMNGLPSMRFGMVNNLITNPYDMSAVINQWKKDPISVLAGIRTFFNELLQNKEFYNVDFSELKFVVAGGMVLPLSLAERWHSVTGVPIIEGYALTEASPMVMVNPISSKKFTGYVGLPIPSTEAKICDENGRELPIEERGEIWIRGPQVMVGYWNDPERTRAILTEEGWLKTGDIGLMNERGYFKLIDRKEDLIKTKDGIAYPSEIETVIISISDVREAVVVQGFSKIGEPLIMAYVIRNNPELSEKIILNQCKRMLSNFQVPNIIEFVDTLPKSPTGFILKRLLRERADQRPPSKGWGSEG
jgi:long-chain acyl-CoA synthetase